MDEKKYPIPEEEGNPGMAAGYFQTVLEIDPDDKIAAMELAKLEC